MTACPVEHCDRPRHHDTSICTHHAWTLERALAETPALITELDTTLARQRGNAAGHGARSADKPLPYDTRASEALWVLRDTLTSWALELGLTVKTRHSTTAIAQALYAHHHTLTTHPDAGQIVDEITTATKEGWRIVQPNNRGRIPLPDPCPEPGCGHRMWATMHDVDDPRPNLVWCDRPQDSDGRHEWRPEQWMRLGHRLGYGRSA